MSKHKLCKECESTSIFVCPKCWEMSVEQKMCETCKLLLQDPLIVEHSINDYSDRLNYHRLLTEFRREINDTEPIEE